ncbi:hypothetical protein SAMN04488020_104254 [Palleronia marisminoris]|uniref:Secreted protein n=2 Tax=Palleronia marisminoris TaxID=315423 RepID=A0A1Y5SLB7_9RHOB|nr:hypothetical protein SAMN04488020_104254 [Palleronia marisminoris]SLN43057.1 hypothetical protein PAM7066_01877 [Palleronia marisminoris]
MKRIATLTAAALIAAPAAFAEQHMVEDEGMTMMQQRLQDALADCNVDVEEEDMMNLTLAQVSGIIIQSGSEESNQDKCQNIEALIQD